MSNPLIVGVDMAAKCILGVKVRPDCELLFPILDGLRLDIDRRHWVERMETTRGNYGIEEDTGQESIGVEIALQLSHNTLTRAEEYT